MVAAGAVVAAGATAVVAAGAVAVVAAGAAAGPAVVTALLDPQLARVKRRPQLSAEALRIFMFESVEEPSESVWAGAKEFRKCFAADLTK